MKITRSCSVSMSLGILAVGSNLCTNHKSISATKLKFGVLKFSIEINLGNPKARSISAQSVCNKLTNVLKVLN